MAEPHPRASRLRKRRPACDVLSMGGITAVVLSGLFARTVIIAATWLIGRPSDSTNIGTIVVPAGRRGQRTAGHCSRRTKQTIYNDIASDLKQDTPSACSLFQRDQWTIRLEIGFEALFAAVAAGLIVPLIALTLTTLKLDFRLPPVAGLFFLVICVHLGFSQVTVVRWFEIDAADRNPETTRFASPWTVPRGLRPLRKLTDVHGKEG